MRTGALEWHLVSDGTFRLDGGAMFGVVPKPLWERKSAPDERNRITLGTNCLLVRTGGRIVLVDGGLGRKEAAKFRDIFGFGEETDLVTSLAAHGVSPDQVDVVVCTHLHFDHAGGLTRLVDGESTPVFPRATHLLQRAELEDALHPTVRSAASYFPYNWEPLQRAGLLELVEGPVDVAPGVRTEVLKGHIRALQGVVLDSGGEKAFYPSDNLPTAAHVPVPWVMGYDLYPLDTVASKESFLPQAADEGWTLIFEHDPRMGAARIHRGDKGFEVEALLEAESDRTDASGRGTGGEGGGR
jgi:glyoxylase-like metal-dependent hydrolase (beta-lactamase superfamily II)